MRAQSNNNNDNKPSNNRFVCGICGRKCSEFEITKTMGGNMFCSTCWSKGVPLEEQRRKSNFD